MSHKQDKEDFEGIEADGIFWNEPPPQSMWVALNRGLVSTGGFWVVAATMLLSSAWFWEELVSKAIREMSPDIDLFWHSIWDNTSENGGCPTQTCRSVKLWLDSIVSAEERLAREHGHEWQRSGLVIGAFDKRKHVIEPIELPEHCMIMAGIDPAGARPYAALWIAYIPLPQNQWEAHIFDESLVPQSAKDFGAFARDFNEKEDGKGYRR